MSHSKEPWSSLPSGEVGQCRVIRCAEDGTVACLECHKVEANANRIVACVNACHGLSTESLEKGDFDFTTRPFAN